MVSASVRYFLLTLKSNEANLKKRKKKDKKKGNNMKTRKKGMRIKNANNNAWFAVRSAQGLESVIKDSWFTL